MNGKPPDDTTDSKIPDAIKPAGRRMKLVKLTMRRVIQIIIVMMVLYAIVLLIGLIPVNNGFEPTADGVEIYVISTAIHADIIVPLSHSAIDWRSEFPADTFTGDTGAAQYVAFGWGDRGVYVDTPTWADLRFTTAAKAMLLPSECCLHVRFLSQTRHLKDAHKVRISDEEYQRLVAFIQRSFKPDAQRRKVQIPDAAYGKNDAFFIATGNYHALNTCNSWVGKALKSTGVRAPWISPMPGSPTLYLPDEP